MQYKEYIIESSVEQLNSFFKDSPVWRDIVGLLNDGLKSGIGELCTHGLDPEKTEFARGRIAQITEIIDFPETTIAYKDMQSITMKIDEEINEEDSDVAGK